MTSFDVDKEVTVVVGVVGAVVVVVDVVASSCVVDIMTSLMVTASSSGPRSPFI